MWCAWTFFFHLLLFLFLDRQLDNCRRGLTSMWLKREVLIDYIIETALPKLCLNRCMLIKTYKQTWQSICWDHWRELFFFSPLQTITSWLKCWYFWPQQTGSSRTDVNKSGVTSLIAILSQQVILSSSGQMENMIARLWTNSRVDVVLNTRPRQRFTEVSTQQPENGGAQIQHRGERWEVRRQAGTGDRRNRVTANLHQTCRSNPKKILFPCCKLLQTYSTNC